LVAVLLPQAPQLLDMVALQIQDRVVVVVVEIQAHLAIPVRVVELVDILKP
jgi:hypothetical protein